MKKTLLLGLALVLTLVGVAGASSKPKTVTRACFGVQAGAPPSRYDVNLYGKYGRVCIVGRRGKRGRNGHAGARGAQGPQGAQGAPGAVGPRGDTGPPGRQGNVGPQGDPGPAGPEGPQGPPGADGLGNGVLDVCVSQGGALQLGVHGQPCDNEGHLPIQVVIVNP